MSIKDCSRFSQWFIFQVLYLIRAGPRLEPDCSLVFRVSPPRGGFLLPGWVGGGRQQQQQQPHNYHRLLPGPGGQGLRAASYPGAGGPSGPIGVKRWGMLLRGGQQQADADGGAGRPGRLSHRRVGRRGGGRSQLCGRYGGQRALPDRNVVLRLAWLRYDPSLVTIWRERNQPGARTGQKAAASFPVEDDWVNISVSDRIRFGSVPVCRQKNLTLSCQIIKTDLKKEHCQFSFWRLPVPVIFPVGSFWSKTIVPVQFFPINRCFNLQQ